MKLDPTFLRGSYTPVVTPFRNGKVDLDRFAALIEGQIEGGSHGIVVAGTTGESTSLSLKERAELFKAAVGASKKRIPVVAGTGSGSYEETAELSDAAEKAGVDALLVVTPYYSRPPQGGLVEYFVQIAKRTSLPVLIYHIPGRAAVSVTSQTVAQIVDRSPNVVGIKHAVHELDLVSELLVLLGKDFRVFCGLESLSLPMLALGAAGVMNAVGNLDPKRVARLCDAALGGRWDEARRLHFELFALSQAIFLDTNPIPLKYMMTRLGLLATPEVRLPLVPLNSGREKALDEVLRKAGLLDH
ncbi:MAG TPA: 4-hydroxy-tetrahydrodipicolinate synthase [Thermoanaerobaculia bacterium]|nr:4-hydroxy-tetrahydrodipicolinate synthase [Thermoanaerobaculia bacterium]